MKVIIVGRDDHSRYIAKVLESKKLLYRYYTFYYNKNNLLGKIIRKIKSNATKRDRVSLKDEHIVNNLSKHLVYQILSKCLKIKYGIAIANKISEDLFDLLVATKIRNADIYILTSQHSLFTMKKIKRKNPNAKIVLDVYAAHPEFRRKIYSKNYTNEKVYLPEDFSIKRINQELILADKIVVPSDHVKKSILSELNIAESKINVINYGCDCNNFYSIKEEKQTNNVKNLIYVGQVSKEKGVNYLIEALEEINSEGVQCRLTIIGKIISKEILARIEENKKTINYIKYVPNAELVYYLNQSDIFVFPSLSESFGMALAEALACGLPVITTKNADSIVKNRYNGLIIEENSVESLTKAIRTLVYDNELRKNLSNNAQSSLKEFTWEKYCEKLIKLCEEMQEDK